MRQIVLDTETTGLDAASGHRVIELAGVELVNRQSTKNNFHKYLNPERLNDVGAFQVHGLGDDFLKGQQKFREVVAEFLEYIAGAELIIHNATFDLAFLNKELNLLGQHEVEHYCPSIIDTLRLAKDVHPGKRNNLNALCERYAVDNAGRALHGALLDAELLAEVYLAMTRGQESFLMEVCIQPSTHIISSDTISKLELLVLPANPEEIKSHQTQLLEIDRASSGRCLWK